MANKPVQIKTEILKTFYQKNPDFVLFKFKLNDQEQWGHFNWEGLDQTAVVEEIRVVRRLYRLVKEPQVVESLRAAGFTGGGQIARLPEETFVERYTAVSKADAKSARAVYQQIVANVAEKQPEARPPKQPPVKQPAAQAARPSQDKPPAAKPPKQPAAQSPAKNGAGRARKRRLRIDTPLLAPFFDQNPAFNIRRRAHLHRPALNELNWEGLDRPQIVRELKIYQRLLALRRNAETAVKLRQAGFISAHHIAATSEDNFVQEHWRKFAGEEQQVRMRKARKTHRKAVDISGRTALYWSNLKEMLASPHYQQARFNNVDKKLIDFYAQKIPSYEELFGNLSHCSCEHCRSIFSPAAYFVDLMHLVHEEIDRPNQKTIPKGLSLKARRPDLFQIPLDCKNTNELRPYLDIVNTIITTRLQKDFNKPEQHLATTPYPFHLPFHAPLTTIRAYLAHFNTDLAAIYGLFGRPERQISRENLELSPEEYRLITTPAPTDRSLRQHYDWPLTDTDLAGLDRLEIFCRQTGLSVDQVTALLYQNLSQAELDHDLARRFFINRGLARKRYLKLIQDKDEKGRPIARIGPLNLDTLDRLNRFIRLSRKLAWSFADLDWVLQSIGAEEIDETAVKTIAQIKQLQSRLELPLDVLCSFWHPLKTSGNGCSDTPALFDRVFNVPAVFYNPESRRTPAPYHPLAPKHHPLYADEVLSWQYEAAETDPEALIRSRLTAALNVSDDELTQLAHHISALQNITDNKIPLTLVNLSHFYRFCRQADSLKLPLTEYLCLVDLLPQKQINTVDDFAYVAGLVAWLKQAGLTVYQLRYILTGQAADGVEKGYTRAGLKLLLADLWTAVDEWRLSDMSFVGERINAELSPVIFKQLLIHSFIDSHGLVLELTPADKLLSALTQLQPASFQASIIGLQAARHVFDQLVAQGILTAEGYLTQPVTEPVDLSMLFTSGGRREEKRELVRQTLLAVQALGELPAGDSPLVALIRQVLRQHRRQQSQGLFAAAATLFATEIPLFGAALALAARLHGLANPVPFLLKPPAQKEEPPTALFGLLATSARILYLARMFKFTAVELQSLLDHPAVYGLAPFDESFTLTLENLQTLTTLKALGRQFNRPNDLANTLNLGATAKLPDDKTLDTLAGLTGWDRKQLAALNKLLLRQRPPANTIAHIAHLKQIFDLGHQLGVNVYFLERLSRVGGLAAGKAADWKTYQRLAQSIRHRMKARYESEQWARISEPIHNRINEAQRDALVAFMIWHLGKTFAGIETRQDLYRYLLIDVEMSGCAQTSMIKQGIGTVQLYIQRCRAGLESGVDTLPPVWWPWLDNYRVWEANRKVFLYPENYIDPALRQMKSPEFKAFEQALLEADITDETVTTAYQNYFDHFAELSRLQIVGSYCRQMIDPDWGESKTLFLVGRTPATPYTYYYRTAVVIEADEEEETAVAPRLFWRPWEKIEFSINAPYVSPVYAFGKLFLFWVDVVEERTPESNGEKEREIHKATIKYTFYNTNKQWAPPQTLAKDIIIGVSGDSNYLDEIEDVARDMNMERDPGKVFWQKAYPLVLPDSSQLNNLLVIYGHLPNLPQLHDQDDLPASPQNVADRQQRTYYNILHNAIARALEMSEESVKQTKYTSIIPAGRLSGNLWVDDENLSIVNSTRMRAGSPPYRGAFDKSCRALTVIKTNNVLYDNYIGDDDPQALTVANVAVFAGGSDDNDETATDVIDLYEYGSGKPKSLGRLSIPRSQLSLVALGNKLIMAGGTYYHEDKEAYVSSRYVDIFDLGHGRVSDYHKLSEPRYAMGATTVGSMALFAGGLYRDEEKTEVSKRVDVYDDVTGQWETLELSKPRYALAATSVGSLALFAGGLKEAGKQESAAVRVDVFDASRSRWPSESSWLEPMELSQHRSHLAAATVGNLAIFAGGLQKNNQASDVVDVYDAEANAWWPADKVKDLKLSKARYDLAATTVDDLVFFGGGRNNEGSDNGSKVVDIYQYHRKSNTLTRLEPETFPSRGRYQLAATSMGRLAVFAGGRYGTGGEAKSSDLVDIYDTETKKWQTAKLAQPRHYLAAPAQNGRESHTLLREIASSKSSLKMVNNQPGWFIFDQKGETFLILPHDLGLKFVTDVIETEPDDWNGTAGTRIQLSYPADTPIGRFPDLRFTFTRLNTHTVEILSHNLFTGGLDRLLTIDSQKASELPFDRFQPNRRILERPAKKVDFSGADGLYFWEIFFHIPFCIANTLNAHQRFAEAQKWYHYIFNPFDGTPDEGDEHPYATYWRFLPLRKLNQDTFTTILDDPENALLRIYKHDPFDPHAIAQLRPTAYQKAIVMKYIDNLLDWGDSLFAQDSWESIIQATNLYELAQDLLGRKPQQTGVCAAPVSRTFQDILDQFGRDIPEFLIELENDLRPGNGRLQIRKKPGHMVSHYFCVIENEDFTAYWDRVEDRLYKIRHCMNIEGIRRQLPLFQPPIDPMLLVRAAATGQDMRSLLQSLQPEIPHYRFPHMLAQAKEVTGTLIQLGSALLNALEKKDVEALVILRTKQEKLILNLTTRLKQQEIEEIKVLQGQLEEGLKAATYRQEYYKELLDDGLSSGEQTSLELTYAAMALQAAGTAVHAGAIGAYLLPRIFGYAFGGMDFGGAVTTSASALEGTGSVLNLAASLVATMAAYERREEEWALQEKLADFDIRQAEIQMEANDVRQQIIERELEIHLQTIKQNEEMEQFLKDKFTNTELYQWLVGRLSILYFQTYSLALNLARSAEWAYRFELDLDQTFIDISYWDSLKKGLLAGEELMFSLQQLENSYVNKNGRPLEIQKAISLLQLDPQALFDLKSTGQCEFEFSEKLFALDFPAHYNRKIKTLSISIPAVAGPYQNIQATLVQLNNRIVREPSLDAVQFLLDKEAPEPDSGILRSNWRPYQQIALSTGVNDRGVFELNFNDERYLPFEGTGANSRWRLEMPQSTNRIDFDTISDVIVNLSYTAQSDAVLGQAVSSLPALQKYTGYLALSLNQQFSTAWHAFMHAISDETQQILTFSISENMFPHNLANHRMNGLVMKLDLSEELESAFEVDLNVSQSATTFAFNHSDACLRTSGSGSDQLRNATDFFGQWSIRVNKATIPGQLVDEGRLDAKKLLNIRLIILYEADRGLR